MKKIYRKPVALTIDVTTEEMIAQSPGNISISPDYADPDSECDAKGDYFDDDFEDEEDLW